MCVRWRVTGSTRSDMFFCRSVQHGLLHQSSVAPNCSQQFPRRVFPADLSLLGRHLTYFCTTKRSSMRSAHHTPLCALIEETYMFPFLKDVPDATIILPGSFVRPHSSFQMRQQTHQGRRRREKKSWTDDDDCMTSVLETARRAIYQNIFATTGNWGVGGETTDGARGWGLWLRTCMLSPCESGRFTSLPYVVA